MASGLVVNHIEEKKIIVLMDWLDIVCKMKMHTMKASCKILVLTFYLFLVHKRVYWGNKRKLSVLPVNINYSAPSKAFDFQID